MEEEIIDLGELFLQQKALEFREMGMDIQAFPARQLVVAEGVKWLEAEVAINGNGKKEKVFFLDLLLPGKTATIGINRIKAQCLIRALRKYAETL
ncbi:MAG TPA: hypothetical protein P5080_06090 [Candidatus Paceibacterota bacterium]|nr:hypothetical protein [Candidatus Pacearchaeota archaeon]HRZ51508.1 hypothetical protein [Candidatus Paceibacterota bacterium]HSA37237.1 hypothetical protein [Candidatus Paceibacterota bacterium]